MADEPEAPKPAEKSGGVGSWLSDFVPPRIRFWAKKDIPQNLWQTCPSCRQMLHHQELKQNLMVCHHCGWHLRLPPAQRFAALFDDGRYQLLHLPEVSPDPLKFRDSKKYGERLKEARAKSGQDEAVLVAHGPLGGREAVAAAHHFDFMGGSLGRAAGEAIVAGAELAVRKRSAYIVFCAAGGARMQEGILSLMQMARTLAGLTELRRLRLPYIVVMTDPTTGGVTASYAMRGDVILAEPGARIGFAGPRVIEQTVREQLPEGFQTAEYLYEHGMVDRVVPRPRLREELIRLCGLLYPPEKQPGPLAAPKAPVGALPRASGNLPVVFGAAPPREDLR